MLLRSSFCFRHSGLGSRFCISGKLLGDAAGARSRITLWVARSSNVLVYFTSYKKYPAEFKMGASTWDPRPVKSVSRYRGRENSSAPRKMTRRQHWHFKRLPICSFSGAGRWAENFENLPHPIWLAPWTFDFSENVCSRVPGRDVSWIQQHMAGLWVAC